MLGGSAGAVLNAGAALPSTSGVTNRAGNGRKARRTTRKIVLPAAGGLPTASGSVSADANGNNVSTGADSSDAVNGATGTARNATGRTESTTNGAVRNVPGKLPSSVNGSANASGGVSAQ